MGLTDPANPHHLVRRNMRDIGAVFCRWTRPEEDYCGVHKDALFSLFWAGGLRRLHGIASSMATSPGRFPACPEFSSGQRIADHLALMRKFKRILDDTERPDRYACRFPRLPTGVSGKEEEGQWRVQCLLMSAEVRYSMYLDVLRWWIVSHGFDAPKDKWPLPPWDVAIIFYAHLLSPFHFKRDIESNFPNLWRAGIEFPLARMRSTEADGASERAWTDRYPNVAYQVVEFSPGGDHAYVTAKDVMDIHGCKCTSKRCQENGVYAVPMTEWPAYRVGRARPMCPVCRTTITKCSGGDGQSLHEIARAWLGFPIFNLWDRPQRQLCKQGFVDRILTLGQPPDSSGSVRYLKFLQLIKESKLTLVPSLDIDLVWHTHQLSPIAYDEYCKTHVGRRINHDDTVRATTRSIGVDNTARLWAARYGESYFDPQNEFRAAEIERQNATCKQKREDMTSTLAAYDDDHLHEKNQRDEAGHRLTLESARLRVAQVAARVLDMELSDAKAAEGAAKSTLRLFNLRLYRRSQRRQLQELKHKRRSVAEAYLDKLLEVERLSQKTSEARREHKRCRQGWEDLQNARRILKQRLTTEEALAVAAVGVFDSDGGDDDDREEHHKLYKEDRYDGSWHSIVPSQVQPCVYPIIGTAQGRELAKWTRADAHGPTSSKPRYSGGRYAGGGGGCGDSGGYGGGGHGEAGEGAEVEGGEAEGGEAEAGEAEAEAEGGEAEGEGCGGCGGG